MCKFSTRIVKPWILQDSRRSTSEVLLVHLNVNGIQNKFDDLKLLNKELKGHVIFLSETKIDCSYSNAQFNLEGYHIYRKDRAKGGGGLLSSISSKLVSQRAI